MAAGNTDRRIDKLIDLLVKNATVVVPGPKIAAEVGVSRQQQCRILGEGRRGEHFLFQQLFTECVLKLIQQHDEAEARLPFGFIETCLHLANHVRPADALQREYGRLALDRVQFHNHLHQ